MTDSTSTHIDFANRRTANPSPTAPVPVAQAPTKDQGVSLDNRGKVPKSALPLFQWFGGTSGSATADSAWHPFSTTTLRFTAPQSGNYVFSGGMWGNTSGVTFSIGYSINGSTSPATSGSSTPGSGNFMVIALPLQLTLKKSDTVDLAYQANAAVSFGSFSFTVVST